MVLSGTRNILFENLQFRGRVFANSRYSETRRKKVRTKCRKEQFCTRGAQASFVTLYQSEMKHGGLSHEHQSKALSS